MIPGSLKFYKRTLSLFISIARCQISDESKDEEVQEKEKKEKKSHKAEKTTRSLASLNSNYRESSSTASESNERVRRYRRKKQKQTKKQMEKISKNYLHPFSFQPTSPISVEDLEKFALRPAPRDVTIQCRVTRDRRGMEKGIYPTYYLHMEKEDGKRVGALILATVISFCCRICVKASFSPSV